VIMLLGHQKQWQYLTRLAEIDKLPQALLFSGQEKLGKRTFAIEFVKWLFKADIEKKQHPDFIFITAEEKEIKISQIRELIWKLSLKPSLGSLKVAIIDQAHCLNQEAQSALLKTLEEPKGKALLILISEYPEMLFPTILSRVQKIKFYPPKISEIKDYLKEKGLEDKELAEIIKFSLGKPGEVIDLVSDQQKLAKRKKISSDINKILNSDIAFRFQYVKEIVKESPEDLKKILEIWLRYFREILISNSDKLPSPFSFGKLKKVIESFQNTIFLLSNTNINPRLALENLMLEI
jgi:DNA polymerase-3 subunit delta'